VHGKDNAEVRLDANLEGYDFPHDSPIVLEARRRTQIERFDWGTVANPRAPLGPNLDSFSDPSALKFRFKVVSNEDRRLLGVVRNLKPETEEEDGLRESLLAVEGNPDMDEVWKVYFDEAEPILQVNTSISAKEELVRSVPFKTLVLPAAFRQIMTSIVNRLETGDAGLHEFEDDQWEARWIAFAEQYAPFEKDGNYEAWIDDCVGEFCNENRLVESCELDP
jgi:hypothetical protein